MIIGSIVISGVLAVCTAKAQPDEHASVAMVSRVCQEYVYLHKRKPVRFESIQELAAKLPASRRPSSGYSYKLLYQMGKTPASPVVDLTISAQRGSKVIAEETFKLNIKPLVADWIVCQRLDLR